MKVGIFVFVTHICELDCTCHCTLATVRLSPCICSLREEGEGDDEFSELGKDRR